MVDDLSLLRMHKALGHAFPERGVCDNYGISGNILIRLKVGPNDPINTSSGILT